ncbi:MAG TPA: ATP-binding protein [Thermodesulfovibrionales bacterium]|nr:ATP-binding protein [Thermodesulfovibrionales bacterium]
MSEGIFSITILLVFMILFFFSLLRIITRIRKEKEKSRQKEESQVSFIVGTFHELVAKLKDKERELEDLRKRAEERADSIESYNEDILQSVPSGVISLDQNLTITKMNSAAARILRLNVPSAIGRRYDEIFREPLKGILDGKKTIERGELQYIADSGKKLHLGLAITPLLNSAKETIGRLMVFTDLTELKALESQAQLRERLSSLGEMSAGMAHELRNPMAVIAGYTNLLSKKVDPSLLHVVDSVTGEIAVMDRIITDFLSFAKPTELIVAPVEVGQVIKTCLSHITGERKDIRVFFNAEKIPLIPGDEVLLRQAFTNLVQNAVDSMPQGGDLRFGFSAEPDSLEITVSDTGHGVPEEIQDKIFLPFYTTKDKGTGLGLAIVHKIIVSHHGSISMENREKGTTFRVRLPLSC